MPFVKSLVFKYTACRFKLVAVILLLSKIMPTYSYYTEKGLVYIIIIAPLGYQPSFYTKYTKSNMYLSCDIRLVSNAKCIFLAYLYTFQSLQLPYLIYLRVLYSNCY